jgi:hypothetical protein
MVFHDEKVMREMKEGTVDHSSIRNLNSWENYRSLLHEYPKHTRIKLGLLNLICEVLAFPIIYVHDILAILNKPSV